MSINIRPTYVTTQKTRFLYKVWSGAANVCSNPGHWVLPALIAACLSISPVAVGGQTAAANPTAVSLAEFTKRVNEYAALHKQMAGKFGELDETKSPAEIATREKTLGEAIRAARPNAQQGDLFTQDVSAIFKKLIQQERRHRSPVVREQRKDAQEEVPAFKPQVNQVYPTTFPLATFPPTLLKVLPPLPKEVEYRLVAGHLILRDTEANLIVDFISQVAI
jgi:hypothetical protein